MSPTHTITFSATFTILYNLVVYDNCCLYTTTSYHYPINQLKITCAKWRLFCQLLIAEIELLFMLLFFVLFLFLVFTFLCTLHDLLFASLLQEIAYEIMQSKKKIIQRTILSLLECLYNRLYNVLNLYLTVCSIAFQTDNHRILNS